MIAMAREPVRYAVVGLGHIAQAAVLPAFVHARANSRLTALISGDPDKLRVAGNRYGVATRGGYDDFDACLEHVDAVYICTPNAMHAEHAMRAARAGKHVLCEKPLAVTETQCTRIIETCRANGVKLMTAYRLHFEAISLEILSRVRRGDIGEPRFFTSTFSMKVRPGGFRTQRELGGGTLFDLGVYCINAARVLFGAEPTHVSAHAISGARSGMPEIEDTAAALLRFSGDRVATFTTSFNAADTSSYTLVGTKGAIHAEPAYAYAEPLAYTFSAGDRSQGKKGRRVDQFAAEIAYFSDCILHNRLPEPSGEEGARDVRIVRALYASARRGTVVTLKPYAPERRPSARQARSLAPVTKRPALVHAAPPHD
ncbi:MAG: Gfo/Idh/MocA family oxidoreductase [Acidobacteria bacterium]|nr:Gfo/Idh/MocA family oxidoreductase [Acidobacteriota bacterium]